MELVSGGTLAERLAAEGSLDPPEVAGLVEGLASALDALHRAGIVHRDVKPQNVLLAPSGPKLGDLGIIRVGDPSDLESAALTVPGATLGTLRFLAPEAILGQAVGPKADAYALAVVAFEAITGRSLRSAVTLGELVDGASRPAMLVSEAKPALGAGFDAAFAAALDIDPDRRLEPFAFAAELREAATIWAASATALIPAVGAEPEAALAPAAPSSATETATWAGLADLNPKDARPENSATFLDRPAAEPPTDSHPNDSHARALSPVVAAVAILGLVFGIVLVVQLLSQDGGAPGASASMPASNGPPTTPTPTAPDATADPAGPAQEALGAVVAAIEASRGGRDGLKGADANELTALANDVGRALDAGAFATARDAVEKLAERTDKVSRDLDKQRREALANAIDVLREAIPPG